MKPIRKRRLKRPVPPRRNYYLHEEKALKKTGFGRLMMRYTFYLGIGITLASSAMMTVIAAAWLFLAPQLPGISSIRDISLQTPLRIYSRDGRLIGEFGEKRRIPVVYENIPQDLINAFVAAEDDRFMFHQGVDLAGLLRAFLEFVQSGEFKSGGSTITMQVARNYFLTRERTIIRKLKEILLAMQLEQELTKQEILELYINKIYLGKRAYGAGAAARVYYGQSLETLNLAQYAMIAGLPKAPSTFNPIVNPERALERRNWILGRMRDLGYIEKEYWREAVQQPITARYHLAPVEVDAGHLGEMARSEMIRLFGASAYTEGYKVVTTIDSAWQQSGQKAVQDGVLDYDWRHGWRGAERQLREQQAETPATAKERQKWGQVLAAMREINGLVPAVVVSVAERSFVAELAGGVQLRINWEQGLGEAREHINENLLGPQPVNASDVVAVGDVVRLLHDGSQWLLRQLPEVEAALVALDPENGAVRSLVGSFEFFESKFNHVTQGKRQPGSGMKPFIYAAGLESGFTPATIFNDAPVVFVDEKLEDVWRPTNDGGRFRGPTRLREAMYRSLNLVSIRLLRKMGIEEAVKTLGKYGFDTRGMRHDLSLSLGSHAMTPMEIVTGYAIFANGGYRIVPWLIERVEDRSGNIVFQANPAVVPESCKEAQWRCREKERENLLATLATDLAGDLPAPEVRHTTAVRVMEERVVYIMDSILRDVVKRGTGRRALRLGRNDLAGKTGTTNGPLDAWFSGYTRQLVATAWLGFDKNQPLGRREYGGSAALPIWIDFMRTALEGQEELSLEQPDGLVVVRIDPETGELAKPDQSRVIEEIFRQEYAPAGSVNDKLSEEFDDKRREQDRNTRNRRSQQVINQLF